MAKRFHNQGSYKVHKSAVIAEICKEIGSVFGVHVPANFKSVRKFFRKLNDYVVYYKEAIAEGQHELHEVRYSDFLSMDCFNGGSLADLIEHKTIVEENQNSTGIFGHEREYLDYMKMQYLNEYLQTIEILKNIHEHNYSYETLYISPPPDSIQEEIHDLALAKIYYAYGTEEYDEVREEDFIQTIHIGWLYVPEFLETADYALEDRENKKPKEFLEWLEDHYVDVEVFDSICESYGITVTNDPEELKDVFRYEGFTGEFSQSIEHVDVADGRLDAESPYIIR